MTLIPEELKAQFLFYLSTRKAAQASLARFSDETQEIVVENPYVGQSQPIMDAVNHAARAAISGIVQVLYCEEVISEEERALAEQGPWRQPGYGNQSAEKVADTLLHVLNSEATNNQVSLAAGLRTALCMKSVRAEIRTLDPGRVPDPC